MSTATPRKYARLAVDPGADADLCALSALDRLFYFDLLRNPFLTKVGTFDLKLGIWEDWAPEYDRATMTAILGRLEAARYLLIDWKSEIGLIRSYVRHDDSLRNWRHAGGVLAALNGVHSDTFKHALAVELSRVDPASICVASKSGSDESVEFTTAKRVQITDWIANHLPKDYQSFESPLAKEQPASFNLQPLTFKDMSAADASDVADEVDDVRDDVKAAIEFIAYHIKARHDDQPSKPSKTTVAKIRILIDKHGKDEVREVARQISAAGCFRGGLVTTHAKFVANYILLRTERRERSGNTARPQRAGGTGMQDAAAVPDGLDALDEQTETQGAA